jgi:hypothetical protein
MIDNNTHYGVLCSGSKTYFVCPSDDTEVKITKAWFTVDEQYIRAWACFFRRAVEEDD